MKTGKPPRPGFLNWGGWKIRKGGASMAATYCWKAG